MQVSSGFYGGTWYRWSSALRIRKKNIGKLKNISVMMSSVMVSRLFMGSSYVDKICYRYRYW